MDKARSQQRQLQKLSRFLSLLLRHRPARFPLKLDDQGYADLSDVMRILHGLPNFRWATVSDIEEIVEGAKRRRFEIIQGPHGKRRIRALYGHSIVCPTYEPVTPPPALYHGTTPDVVGAIRSDGLRPMGLQYVHLAATVELARHIGLRRTSSPIILRVNALQAHAHGVRFYNPETDIFLSEFIPPEFIESPEQR